MHGGVVPPGRVRIARREVGLRSYPLDPAPTTGYSIDGQGRHAPLELTRTSRITQTEVGARNRSAQLPVTEYVGGALTAAAARHDPAPNDRKPSSKVISAPAYRFGKR